MTDKKSPFDALHMTDAMKSQAQQIWLAGLGAFSKAQQDGAKAFEKLVGDGIGMQHKMQNAAEGLAEATQRATEAARQFSDRANGQWDKLEGIFEQRVAKALSRMGVPSAQELQTLQARIEALEAQLAQGNTVTTARTPSASNTATKKRADTPLAPAKTAAKSTSTARSKGAKTANAAATRASTTRPKTAR